MNSIYELKNYAAAVDLCFVAVVVAVVVVVVVVVVDVVVVVVVFPISVLEDVGRTQTVHLWT